jgi:hypothetical protein
MSSPPADVNTKFTGATVTVTSPFSPTPVQFSGWQLRKNVQIYS